MFAIEVFHTQCRPDSATLERVVLLEREAFPELLKTSSSGDFEQVRQGPRRQAPGVWPAPSCSVSRQPDTLTHTEALSTLGGCEGTDQGEERAACRPPSCTRCVARGVYPTASRGIRSAVLELGRWDSREGVLAICKRLRSLRLLPSSLCCIAAMPIISCTTPFFWCQLLHKQRRKRH